MRGWEFADLLDGPMPRTPHDVRKFSPGKVHDRLSDHYPDKVLDWVKDAAWSDPTEIKLKHIDMARRPGGRDMKKVRGMAKAIKAGKKMDPIYLVDTPSAPPLVIADGYHRALAHQHAGKQTILAHVASVDEEHGPWDRAMHDAKLNKVGPKGYIHGWIYVGPQAPGSRVYHPEHGHGTVNSHELDPGKKVRGSIDVHFDSGEKHSFRARFKDSSKPRLYGPAKTDEQLRTEGKMPPAMAEMQHPKLAHDLRLELSDFAVNSQDRTVGEITSHGPLDNRTYGFHHSLTGHKQEGGFGSKDEALQALADYDTKFIDERMAFMADLQREKEAQDEIDRKKRQDEDEVIYRPRRDQAIYSGLPRGYTREMVQRRQRIVDLHGANLRIHDPDEPITAKHLREFFALPESHHEVIARRGYQIDMGRGTVADYHPELSGIQPNGYEEGKTWHDSAGAHSTGNGVTSPWLVFGNTVRHGSRNMVAHEMGHALDHSLLRGTEHENSTSISGDSSSPWGAGFLSYFDGLNAYDKEQLSGSFQNFAEPEKSSYIPLMPYYRSHDHGGHFAGNKEMFAEAYAAYVTIPRSKKDQRAEAITRTLKGGHFDGDDHIGKLLAEYFDDLTEWIGTQ